MPRLTQAPRRSRIVIGVALLAAILTLTGLLFPPAGGAATSSPYTFDDEFSGVAGARPSAQWSFQTGGNGWGNGELQQYTDRTVNAHLDGSGHLAIVARRETYKGSDGITRG